MRDAIFIVGMGRSGSSALTRVLSLLGGALPLRTLPANFANPTGYWEPVLAVGINDRFLRGQSSSWYDATLRLQTGAAGGRERDALVAEAAEFLSGGFEPDGPIVLKDPRISALLPYWTAAAARAGLRPKVIHNFRRPDDVAASLASRDGLAVGHSNALWLKYNLVPERDGRPYPRVFVSYEMLMTDWRRVATTCIERLGLALTLRSAAAVSTFLSAELRHHATPAAHPVHPDGEGLLARTYALLCAAEKTGPDLGAFDAALREYMASAVRSPAPDTAGGTTA